MDEHEEDGCFGWLHLLSIVSTQLGGLAVSAMRGWRKIVRLRMFIRQSTQDHLMIRSLLIMSHPAFCWNPSPF